MTKTAYTARARADLIEIGGHIALNNAHYAQAFIARLEDKAQRASRMPRIYRQRNELAPGLRSIPVGKYLIFFRIVAEGIEIIRIVHGARDLKMVFGRA